MLGIFKRRPPRAKSAVEDVNGLLLYTAQQLRKSAKDNLVGQMFRSAMVVGTCVIALKKTYPQIEIEDDSPFMELLRLNAENPAAADGIRSYMYHQLDFSKGDDQLTLTVMWHFLAPHLTSIHLDEADGA